MCKIIFVDFDYNNGSEYFMSFFKCRLIFLKEKFLKTERFFALVNYQENPIFFFILSQKF